MTPLTRRRAIVVAAAAAISAQSVAHAQTTTVRVGFVPVIGAAALFLLDGAGWARDAGLTLATTKFDSGPAAVQAFASGTLDVLAIGVAPVALARARGFDATVVCAGGLGGSTFTATPDLAARFAEAHNAPAPALAAFRRATGRPAKLGTLPPGAVPTVALKYWFDETGKVDPADVEFVTLGIEAVQQAMLAGAIDGGTVLEPSATIVRMRNSKLQTIVTSLDMFPHIPGLVFAVSRRFLEVQRASVVALVRLIAHATATLRDKPDAAAPYVAAVLGGGLIDPRTMTFAMRSKAIEFNADPRLILAATQAMLEYEVRLGDFPMAPATSELFDLSVWDEAMT